MGERVGGAGNIDLGLPWIPNSSASLRHVPDDHGVVVEKLSRSGVSRRVATGSAESPPTERLPKSNQGVALHSRPPRGERAHGGGIAVGGEAPRRSGVGGPNISM